ncbi:MAG TPA: phenylalanine--tRNA ligase subunit beta [Verrucomicrobiae bacterium]|nr:phenylalanine--tRNA ligase subunit beta [Verrucomicrobiae bacterium]
MKVTLNWLKQYVDFNWSPEELTERLTMLGLEVEGVQKISGAFDGIVVAQVVARDKHPNADKLSLCRVNDGTGERQIVCGAQNFKAGDKVPLILPGASLPPKPGEKEPFTIKVGKIRGVESHGMLCSHEELQLDPETIGLKKEDGLLILREDAKVGQPFGEYLGRSGSDVVYDLEVTPNRPDLNSVIGIAREIAAVTGNELKIPTIQFLNTESEPINGLVSVQNDEPELCPRYTARIVRKVKVGPSPDWLRSILEKVGIRSINNVVDITNYVMLESGQPLHAFDYHLLKGIGTNPPKIVIRRANESEKFTTLDGKERALTNQMLLIADETKAVALAGVMGGKNSEINANTTDVLIESAYFKPQNIRATSKKLELRTDSSYRFERGGDVEICDWASRRAAQLICDLAGGQVLGHSIDNFPHQSPAKPITLHFAKTKDLLGIGISHSEQVSFLIKLGLTVTDQTPGICTFKIPSWRVDLKREVDLIEEVGRLYGIEKIPATPPRGALGANAFDSVYDQIAEARRILSGLGLNEAQGQTLISKSEVRSAKDEEIVALANPLSSDMDVLRPSLLPGLIHSLRYNISRKNYDVALFEIGRVFNSQNGTTKEERRVAIALTGQRALPFWNGGERDAKFDACDLKGITEEFFEQFGLRGIVFARRDESTPLFLESATISLGGKLPLGELGQLLPMLAKKYDLRDAVFLAEFNLDLLLARRNPAKSFKALPQFPSIRRDVAMLVPEATTHESVLQTVKQTKPANLENVELFDVFRGKNVPEGQKSLAYAFTYRATEKTLTDAEVNTAHLKIVDAFKQQLQAGVRE